ncbi:RuBisCO-associated protein [Senna tora]|uniref:RuBisCO-associated protein n=1 Tax=Senna tora TaxID=362788 RepID=A0A835CJA6_9FABA|nr:RuBisCO-associated protein [Senna tora]
MNTTLRERTASKQGNSPDGSSVSEGVIAAIENLRNGSGNDGVGGFHVLRCRYGSLSDDSLGGPEVGDQTIYGFDEVTDIGVDCWVENVEAIESKLLEDACEGAGGVVHPNRPVDQGEGECLATASDAQVEFHYGRRTSLEARD